MLNLKIIPALFTLFFCALSAQKNLPFDSAKIAGALDLLADDYGNIYIKSPQDFSFTAYDSLGAQKGKLMFTVPFKIQSVQNPLNIPAFSENAQELKFFDQNLAEIQTINLRQKFGFIKMAYAEDLHQIWLLDESGKRLIQYNFRDEKILNSLPFDIDFENVRDLIVFQDKVYILTTKNFLVYTLKAQKIADLPVENGKRLRRENKTLFVVTNNSIYKFDGTALQPVFAAEKSRIVDKNSASIFVISGNKLYLYPDEK